MEISLDYNCLDFPAKIRLEMTLGGPQKKKKTFRNVYRLSSIEEQMVALVALRTYQTERAAECRGQSLTTLHCGPLGMTFYPM
jgi:hypothetical protein